MDIANSQSVSIASSYAQADTADAVSMLMLRKAIDVQATGAQALLSALPQQPALAVEGSLGRNVNTYA
ncbi:MAG: YjfB family protein [Paucibacter sp.]|nr:YjfB family protein [Roseateles sp.]